MRLFVKWLICCGAILLAWSIFPGAVFISSWAIVIGAGTVLWIVNIFIRPIAQLASILITLLTMGIFSVIVNAAMVCLTDIMIPGLHIGSFWICVFVALIISAGNVIFAPRTK